METRLDNALLPSSEEIEAFRADGFYFSRRIFTDDELDRAIQAQDRFYEAPPNWPYAKRRPGGWKKGDAGKLRKSDYTSLMVPELMNLVLKPILGKIAARLMGERMRLWHDQLSYKEAGDSGDETVMGWHNDRGYWLACSSTEMISAWIPFTDLSEAMGPITFLRGSHRWEGNDNLDFFSRDLPALEKKILHHGNPLDRVPARLRRGEVSFHHCRTLHCSTANRSDRPRRALAVHMQPVSNRPVDGFFHFNKLLAGSGGKVDFADPKFFPLLGAEDGSC